VAHPSHVLLYTGGRGFVVAVDTAQVRRAFFLIFVFIFKSVFIFELRFYVF
jgi:hypothetical protein